MKKVPVKEYLTSFSWLGVLVSVLLALLWPDPGEKYLAPFVRYFLMLLMFLASLDVDFQKAKLSRISLRTLVFALAVIHFATVIPVWLLQHFFDPEVYIGFLLIAGTATGMSNIFFSQLLGGEVYLALVVVSLSNLLAPLIIPIIILFFAQQKLAFPLAKMVFSLMEIVLLPMLLGRVVIFWGLKQKIKELSPYLSFGGMFFLVYGVVAPMTASLARNLNETLSLSFLVLCFLSVSYLLGRLLGKNRPERITLSLSCSFKNFTMAIVIAQEFFAPLTVLPAVVYALISNFLLAPLQYYYLKKKH
ncbi:MAG: bile acid:sodium symporter [Leptospiraceae bacterium]|nr:bile acid:sodium symporter [Leptospiraceae bacterium]MDW8305853.1 bile acid:sodium symporter [Leptospiraceae bacterium]